jgi:hypothetical protein
LALPALPGATGALLWIGSLPQSSNPSGRPLGWKLNYQLGSATTATSNFDECATFTAGGVLQWHRQTASFSHAINDYGYKNRDFTH